MKNIDKITYYLQMVSKGPINIDGAVHNIDRNCIRLAPTFFLKDDCIGCGACCAVVPEDNVLTEDEYNIIMNVEDEYLTQYGLDPSYIHDIRTKLRREEHIINGYVVPIYIYHGEPNQIWVEYSQKYKKACHWMVYYNGRYRCMIHPGRSITCRIPHLKMRVSKSGNVSLGVSQYGRNWAIGCPIKFVEPIDEDMFNSIKNDRIDTLNRLETVAQRMHVETYIPEIVKYIENIPYENYKNYLERPIVEFSKTHRLL